MLASEQYFNSFLKVLVVIGIFLTGCQSTPPPVKQMVETTPTIKSTVPPQQNSALDLTTEMKASHPWKIAFAPKFKLLGKTGELSSYWLPAWEAAEQMGEDLGVDVELIVSEALCDTDMACVEPQIRLIADLIERNDIDGMIIAPFDSNRLGLVVDKAIAAGIPTIAMDTAVNSDHLLTFVVFDNFAAGQVIGEWVVEQLGGTGKVLILEGPADQQNALDRRNGFLAGLQSGNIDILDTQSADWETEPAKETTLAWLQEYSDIDAILAANDNMALGAAEAVIEANRPGIIITGFDATDLGLAAIEEGHMAATIDQAPDKQAQLAIQLLVRHLEIGETFPAIIFMPEIPLVTKENVGDYLSEYQLN